MITLKMDVLERLFLQCFSRDSNSNPSRASLKSIATPCKLRVSGFLLLENNVFNINFMYVNYYNTLSI